MNDNISKNKPHRLGRGRKTAGACLLLAIVAWIALDLLAKLLPLDTCLLYRRIYTYSILGIAILSLSCGVVVFLFGMRGQVARIAWFLVIPGLILSTLVASSLYTLPRVRGVSYMKRCVQNLQKLADEMVKYAKTNDGRLPPTEHWCDELISGGNVTEADFVCGESFWPGHFSYGMNANLDGASINDISPETVILFEICGDRNASGEAELAVYRHDVYGESFKTSNFLLGNFRVKSLTREQAERLKWEVNK